MLPSSNQGLGMNIGFPDVCLTPAAPSPIPVPYPNLGQNAVGMPFCPTILLAFCPAHNMGAKPMITNGDEAGCAHATFIGTGSNNMGNPRILLQGQPAETLCNPTAGNRYNDGLGAKLVPSLTNCLMGAAPGSGGAALLAELLDRPAELDLGLTLEPESGRSGWRVLHARRGGRGARAGVRAGDRLLTLDPRGLEVLARRRTRALALPAPRAQGPLRVDRDAAGLLRLVLRRCSLGAPQALAAALRAPARALLLDLRGNPGGEVRVAEQLAAQLAPHAARLVVLVDGTTASAAELLSATLAGHGAVLAGAPTHGKLLATPHRRVDGALLASGLARPMCTPDGRALARVHPELDLAAGVKLARRRCRRPVRPGEAA